MRNTNNILGRLRKALFSTLFKSITSKIGLVVIVIFLLFVFVGSLFIPYGPGATSSATNSPPSVAHLLGTDFLGHDVLSQVLWGAYPSMAVGAIAALAAVLIGLFVGVLAGYYTRLEGPLMGSTDAILTFPPLPLMVLLGTLYPATNLLLILILTLVLFPPIARAIRSQVLSVRERPYIDSSRITGQRDWEIMLKIIVPEVVSIAFAYLVLAVASGIVLVTALEFLGVGNPDIVSWGSMLYWAQQYAFNFGDWWWIAAPGAAITILAVSLALIGFSIEEVMNPRLRS